MTRDVGSRSREIITVMVLFLVLYFVNFAVMPLVGPLIFGATFVPNGPWSWVISGVVTLGMWLFIKFLLYNVKRERTVL